MARNTSAPKSKKTPPRKNADKNTIVKRAGRYARVSTSVGGLAAKKLGLLAVAGVFLLKAWKLALLGLVVVGAAARRVVAFFTRRKPVEPQ